MIIIPLSSHQSSFVFFLSEGCERKNAHIENRYEKHYERSNQTVVRHYCYYYKVVIYYINLIWTFEGTGKYRWKGRLILSPQLLIFSIQVELLILVTYMSLGFPLHEQHTPTLASGA